MKYIKYLILSFLSLIVFQSCYKDKGNYEYTTLDEIIIDTANQNIKEKYAIFRLDTLKIAPKLYFNGQLITNQEQVKEKLAFTWSIYQATIGQNIYSVDTISHDLILNQSINKQAGNWILLLTVRDVATNISTYQKFSLNISEFTSGGWMVLYERDGNTDLGLIIDDRVKNGIIQPRVLLDLVKLYNGSHLNGKPINMFHSQMPIANGYVFIATEKDFVGLTNENLTIINSFNDHFFPETTPSTKGEAYIQGNPLRTEVLLNDNKVYSRSFMLAGTNRDNTHFSLPIAGNYGELALWLPTGLPQSSNAIVYDSTNKKFLQSTSATNRFSAFVPQNATVKFDVNNVGLDLMTSDWGKGLGPNLYYEYFLMKNNTNKYLLVANFNTPNAVGVNKFDVTNLPDIDGVTSIAASLSGNFIYYVTDNKLYRYLYGTSPIVDLVWTAPAGESITRIELQKTYDFTYMLPTPTVRLPSANKLVHIATWNENNKNGKVYNIIANDLNGNLDLSSQRVYTGFGKIKDMKQKLELN